MGSDLDFKRSEGGGKVREEWPSRYVTDRNICQISRVYTHNLAVKVVLMDLCFQSVMLIIPITLLAHWLEESFDLILYRQWLLFLVLFYSVCFCISCAQVRQIHVAMHTGVRKDGGCLMLPSVALEIHLYVFYNYIPRTSENWAVSLLVPWLSEDWI